MNELQSLLYEFDNFQLDTKKGLLLRQGEIVPVSLKTFTTLLALVKNNGTMMTKDELMEIIWPDTVVEENNLTQYISALRKILGEGQNGNPYIETIPKRGYRFVAEVRELNYEEDELVIHKRTNARIMIEEDEITQDAPPIKTAVPDTVSTISNPTEETTLSSADQSLTVTHSRLLNRKFLATFVILLILLGIAIWKLIPERNKQSSSNNNASLNILSIANWKGEAGSTAYCAKFSPDGTLVAFPIIKNEKKGIYLKQLDGGEPLQISSDAWFDHSLIWSPDGQRIAYIANRGNQKGIWTIPYLGGEPTPIKMLEKCEGNLILWSQDASKIYYESEHNLFSLDIASGQITQLTEFDSLTSAVHYFSVSPSEKQIAYTNTVNGQTDIFVLRLQDRKVIQVTNDTAHDSYIAGWFPNEQGVLYCSKRSNNYQTCRAYLSGQQPSQITFGDNQAIASDISPVGKKILYFSFRDEADLWSLNLHTNEETQITSDLNLELWSDASPDGYLLAYQSAASDALLLKGSIMTCDVQGKEQQVKLTREGFAPKWSPDGKTLAFLRSSDDQNINLWAVKDTGLEEKQLTYDGVLFEGFNKIPYNKALVSDYCWSPDSNYLLYCSNKTGVWNVWKISADGLTDTNISNNTDTELFLSCPMWSPDGRQIAYRSQKVLRDKHKTVRSIWLHDSEKSESIFQTDANMKPIGWSPLGKALLIAVPETTEKPRDSFTDGKIINVLNPNQTIPLKSVYLNNIRLSPDGQWIAFTSREHEKDVLNIMRFNGEQLKRIVEAPDRYSYFSSIIWSPDGSSIYYGKQQRRSLISMIENFS